MKNLILFVILGIFINSCVSNKLLYDEQGANSLIETIVDTSLPDKLGRFKKKEIQLINHKDTIVEKSYDFIIPKNFESQSSTFSYFPTVHTFKYSNKQFISIVQNRGLKVNSEVNLSKETFKEKLKDSKVGIIYDEYLKLNNIDLLDGRLYEIMEDENVTYFFGNLLESEESRIPINLLRTHNKKA